MDNENIIQNEDNFDFSIFRVLRVVGEILLVIAVVGAGMYLEYYMRTTEALIKEIEQSAQEEKRENQVRRFKLIAEYDEMALVVNKQEKKATKLQVENESLTRQLATWKAMAEEFKKDKLKLRKVHNEQLREYSGKIKKLKQELSINKQLSSKEIKHKDKRIQQLEDERASFEKTITVLKAKLEEKRENQDG